MSSRSDLGGHVGDDRSGSLAAYSTRSESFSQPRKGPTDSDKKESSFFNASITAETLRSQLSYDPVTGNFVWITGRRAGRLAGCSRPDGYRVISISRRQYLAHRLAWLYVKGEWPNELIDHIDGDASNNAFHNIRAATYTQNQQNSKRRGYFFHRKKNRFVAKIRINKKQIHVGMFATAEEARAAYDQFAKKHFGEFSNRRAS